LGAILLEVEDRDVLSKDLKDSKQTIETHLVRLNERETEIRAEYTRVAENLE
jgi:chaperonin cofactor prefoldin